jgi:deoxyribose-phosphate aldolase
MTTSTQKKMTKKQIAAMIDQTLLSQTASSEQVASFCKEAATYGFASVCINPLYIPLAAKLLAGTKTKVCTVIDFPLGAGGTKCKVAEAKAAVAAGADELDFVVDIGMVKAHEWEQLEKGLSTVVAAVRALSEKRIAAAKKAVVTKLILETCFLSDEEITESSLCAKRAGFDFVKTSTGFAIMKDKDGKLLPNGATVHAVTLMRAAVGKKMGVKASGGIHTTEQALALIEAGATRIGASAGVQIVAGIKE